MENDNYFKNSRKLNDTIDSSTSEEYLAQPLRYADSYRSSSLNSSETTLTERDNTFYSCRDFDATNMNIPIVGYEILEERARFTVYKLKIENKVTGESWYVFRRYTDFVRLCNKLKMTRPEILKYVPRKRWLGNNFDPIFLEERVNSLQTLVNFILNDQDLLLRNESQDFFCLNDPPDVEVNEESRAVFEALEETVTELKQQLSEKDRLISSLQSSLHSKMVENDNMKKRLRSLACSSCLSKLENILT